MTFLTKCLFIRTFSFKNYLNLKFVRAITYKYVANEYNQLFTFEIFFITHQRREINNYKQLIFLTFKSYLIEQFEFAFKHQSHIVK